MKVFDIQRFSVHDGPGIRTTVFTAGCPLQCRWCHNPEGLSIHPVLRYEKEKCIQCGICVRACSNKVHQAVNGTHHIHRKNCSLCGNCVRNCPSQALGFSHIEYTPEQLLDIVSRDKIFYKNQGGVTFSGGECTMQPDLLETVKLLHTQGIDVCIDTCGYADTDLLLNLIPFTQFFLYDIKAYV